jgi:hypothetical protein
VPGHDSLARSGVDLPLTWTPAGVSALNAPIGGAGMEAAARDALERDGNSLEGAFGPRSRRGPARGGRPAPERGGVPLGGRPTLERDRTSLERGGFVPGRHRTPRAERSSARGWLGRLFDGPWAHGFVLCACLGSFSFIYLRVLAGFPWLFRGPSWLSPTVASEHLWVYP